MTLTLPPLETIRQAAYPYEEGRLADESAWQAERVYFPRCLECISKKIQALEEFSTAGWDGARAEPIDSKSIEAACRFVAGLADHGCGEALIDANSETDCLVPHCVPLVTGRVQLEWHIGDRILELEFVSPDTIRYLKWWPGHDIADDEASYDADDLDFSADLIRWVCYGDATP